MLRRVLVAVFGLIVILAGGWALWQRVRSQPPRASATNRVAPAAPALPRTEPPPATPPPAPEPERGPATPSRSARRAAAPKEPAPVEAVPSAPMATLRIDSDVAGAQVFIDRNYIGVTPITSPEIAPGAHRVNVVAPGYESIAENIDVEAGTRDLQFNFKEVRLDAT